MTNPTMDMEAARTAATTGAATDNRYETQTPRRETLLRAARRAPPHAAGPVTSRGTPCRLPAAFQPHRNRGPRGRHRRALGEEPSAQRRQPRALRGPTQGEARGARAREGAFRPQPRPRPVLEHRRGGTDPSCRPARTLTRGRAQPLPGGLRFHAGEMLSGGKREG